MTINRRHTNAEIRAAIDALEARGWSINADGTITRTRIEVKKLFCDPRLKNAEPRYSVVFGSRQATIKPSDLIAAKFGAGAAKEQPDEVEVGLGRSFAPETCPEPASRGPCSHCGGFMVRGDGNERKCLQCGRANAPQRVLTPTERIWFRKG